MTSELGIDIPDIRIAKRILAVQPHYDDNDISAGGTLAALALDVGGAEVYYLTMSDDLVGVVDESWSAKEATRRLREDAARAGEIMGVKGHYWLGYPDAGEYNYFDVRRDIIRHMRMLQPDVLFLPDPWTPYEAHMDHFMAGRAAVEAAILFNFTRIKTDPQVDAAFQPHPLQAVVFYTTAYPNTVFDISSTVSKKNAAMRCYQAQFEESGLEELVGRTGYYARFIAREHGFEFGEALKIVPPDLLHGVGETLRF
jgi:LmbE family N-acetylglucosaminyl deacetylase